MTTCACSGRASASRTARSAASRSPSRRRSRSSTGSSRWPRAPGSRCSRRSSASARASTSTCSADLQTKGFARVRVDGVVHPLTEPPKLKKQEKHTIEAVVDRLVVPADQQAAHHRLDRDGARPRRRRSSSSTSSICAEDDPHRERRYSERLACPNDHPLAIDELEPRSFSFNSPFGACPVCTGLGTRHGGRPRTRRPRPGARRCAEGAIAPWATGQTSEYFLRLLQGVGRAGRLRRRHALGAAAGAGAEGGAARHRRPGARQLPQPVRPRPLVLRGLRGRRAVDRAALHRDRERLLAREVRGLHARGARARRVRAPGSSRRSSP